MGPLYGHPSIAAVSIATLCHVPLSGLLTLLVGSILSNRLCWQITGPPIAAARLVICHGPPYRPPHAAARSRVSHGSLYGLTILLLSPSPHSANVPLSGLLTLLVGSILS
ncbi:unnamed protein product, partial [Staurois parvus]